MDTQFSSESYQSQGQLIPAKQIKKNIDNIDDLDLKIMIVLRLAIDRTRSLAFHQDRKMQMALKSAKNSFLDSTGSCYSDQCFDTIDSIAQAMITLDSEIFESDFQPANSQSGHDFGDQR